MQPWFSKGKVCSLDLARGKRAAFCLAKKPCCLLFSKEDVLPFVWQRRRAVFGKEGVLPFVWQEGVLPYVYR